MLRIVERALDFALHGREESARHPETSIDENGASRRVFGERQRQPTGRRIAHLSAYHVRVVDEAGSGLEHVKRNEVGRKRILREQALVQETVEERSRWISGRLGVAILLID